MTTVFHARRCGKFINLQSNLAGRNFIERIKAPIFLDALLAIETMQELQSNSEEKVNSSILKDDFSSRASPSTFTSLAPMLLY